MNETTRIADQIERCWSGPAWHGPALSEILEDVDADQAARHPIENAHSIWELVLHAAAWAEAARASLESGETHLSDEENFPPVLASEPSTWEAAKRRLESAHHDLAAAVKALEDSELSRTVRGMNFQFSLYVLFHGVVQHSLYHAGQIVLLKKGS